MNLLLLLPLNVLWSGCQDSNLHIALLKKQRLSLQARKNRLLWGSKIITFCFPRSVFGSSKWEKASPQTQCNAFKFRRIFLHSQDIQYFDSKNADEGIRSGYFIFIFCEVFGNTDRYRILVLRIRRPFITRRPRM